MQIPVGIPAVRPPVAGPAARPRYRRHPLGPARRLHSARNSTPIFCPSCHTRRHRRGVFGGRSKVNSSGISVSVEIITHAPPIDRFCNMPRCQRESSNLNLTIWFLGSRGVLRRSATGSSENRGKDIGPPLSLTQKAGPNQTTAPPLPNSLLCRMANAGRQEVAYGWRRRLIVSVWLLKD
jgi:hypothetical protein